MSKDTILTVDSNEGLKEKNIDFNSDNGILINPLILSPANGTAVKAMASPMKDQGQPQSNNQSKEISDVNGNMQKRKSKDTMASNIGLTICSKSKCTQKKCSSKEETEHKIYIVDLERKIKRTRKDY